MSFEAYSVAIRLRLVDSVSSGLIAMAGQFAAFNRHVNASQANLKALEGHLQRIKTLAFAGGALFGFGAGGLYALKAPLEEAIKWQQEAGKFATLGFGPAVNRDAQEFAKGMKTYGTSARENLALLGDAMSVFKDLQHAKTAAPILAKIKFGNEAIFGEGAASNERQFMDMLKVIELRRGLSSNQEFATQANFVQKAISGSRGRVNASQWLQLLKTGGVGISQMSNEAFYLGLEPLVQEFGGFRLGTAIMSIYQNLVQARASVTSQQELFRLGLLDPHLVQFNQLGQLKKAMPGAFVGSGIFEREGPLALMEKVLIPAFARHGITTEPQILDELGRILSNRTASSLLSRAYQQRASIAMQASANRNAMGIDQLVEAGRNTPEGKFLELHAKWRDVLRELGTAVLPIAIKAVEGLTGIIKGMLAFAREFPTLSKALVIAFAGLSGLMVAGGAVTLITAGFRALGLALAVGKGIGLGAQLIQVAGGLGNLAASVGMVLGKLGLVGAAGGAGYLLGDLINRLGPNGDLGGWLGGKVYEFFHPYDASSRAVHVTTHVNLDGRKVAAVVSQHQGRAASAPQTGSGGFDPRLQMIPAGGY
jgi:hypothetical protein